MKRGIIAILFLLATACGSRRPESYSDSGKRDEDPTGINGDSELPHDGLSAKSRSDEDELNSGTSVNNGGSTLAEAAESFAPNGSLFKEKKRDLAGSGYVQIGEAYVEWSGDDPIKNFSIHLRYRNAVEAKEAILTASGKMRTSPPAPGESDVRTLESVRIEFVDGASDDDDISDEDMQGPWGSIDCGDAPRVDDATFARLADSMSFHAATQVSPGYFDGVAELTVGGRSIEIAFHQHGRCVALGNYEGVSWGGLDGVDWIEPTRYFFVSDDGLQLFDEFNGDVWAR